MKFHHNSTGTKKCLIFISAFFLFSILSACVPQERADTSNINANVNTVSNTNETSQSFPDDKEMASRMPVTLPILNAMFQDEEFSNELKAKLGLTDLEIDKIKKVSTEAVSGLSEDNSDFAEYSGSTKASVAKAEDQINEILGEEKTGKLFSLVRERWSNGNIDDESIAKSTVDEPNSVPTDTRIVVNAPEFRMDLFQEGKLVKSYKIGIGYPEFPLPSGLRKADSIIFNPTWTPPDEPWVKGAVKPGKTIEAGSKQNPLGPIKIPIGLPSLIHGGKAPARLGNFASHGCVGLTSPQIQDFSLELAKLSGTDLTDKEVKTYEKNSTETKDFKLDKSMLVELRYETIVVEDGKLKIFRDVYERGTNTEENLRKKLQQYNVSLDDLKNKQEILDGLKQMAVDAQGDEVESNSNTNSNANQNKNAENKDGKVTRNIKGKKEVSFEIAELKGKGYPAPVDMK